MYKRYCHLAAVEYCPASSSHLGSSVKEEVGRPWAVIDAIHAAWEDLARNEQRSNRGAGLVIR
jgi:hypothetical protein